MSRSGRHGPPDRTERQAQGSPSVRDLGRERDSRRPPANLPSPTTRDLPVRRPSYPQQGQPPPQMRLPATEPSLAAEPALELQHYYDQHVPWDRALTIRDLSDQLDRVSPLARRDMYDRIMTNMSSYTLEVAAIMAALIRRMEQDTAVMKLYGGLAEFQSSHAVIKNVRNWREAAGKQVGRDQKRIADNWPLAFRDNVMARFNLKGWNSVGGTARLAFLATRGALSLFVPAVNRHFYERLGRATRGQSAERCISPEDFIDVHREVSIMQRQYSERLKELRKPHAAISLNDPGNMQVWLANAINSPRPIPEDWVRDNNFEYETDTGLLVPRTEHESIGVLLGSDVTVSPSAAGGARTSPMRGVEYEQAQITMEMPSPSSSRHVRARSLADAPDSPKVPLRQVATRVLRPRGEAGQVLNALDRMNQLMQGVPDRLPRPLPEGSRAADARTRHKQQRLAAENPALAREVDGIIDSQYDQDAIDDLEDAQAIFKKGAGCGCHEEVSERFKAAVRQAGYRKLSASEQIKFLVQWYREAGPSKSSTKVCFNHTRLTANKLGLVTRGHSHTHLVTMLRCMYFHQDKIGDMRADDNLYLLFRKGERAQKESDILKSYRFLPNRRRPVIDRDRILRTFGGVRELVRNFARDGNVVADCFQWVTRDPELMHIIEQEYDMYWYHTRLIGGKGNLGWCRTQYHSLGQQLVRGDLNYWFFYAILRDTVQLISYPYYSKYTKPGDQTYFRHIDLNIAAAVGYNHMVDIIQGSVSWDDEDDENCTQILIQMHRHLKTYQAWRAANRRQTDGAIEAWKDETDFPPEAQALCPGVRWENVICKKGQVRITDPRIPHGSTGPATRRRRTMLPWYVRLQDDHETMENPAMGSYQDLKRAHSDLTMAPRSPSGHPNMYGGINEAFPGAIPPEFMSHISRAIHCQERWDSPLVIKELYDYLGSDATEERWAKHVADCRSFTARWVKEQWEVVKKFEEEAYGERSFFVTQGKYDAVGEDHGHVTKDDAYQQLLRHYSAPPEQRWLDAEEPDSSPPSSPPDTPVPPTPTPFDGADDSATGDGKDADGSSTHPKHVDIANPWDLSDEWDRLLAEQTTPWDC